MLVLDKLPWKFVEKAGFVRFISQAAPKLTIHTEKYYRENLDEFFEKVETAVMEMLRKHDPSYTSLGFDGWSQSHHGYIGYMLHYLHDWKR